MNCCFLILSVSLLIPYYKHLRTVSRFGEWIMAWSCPCKTKRPNVIQHHLYYCVHFHTSLLLILFYYLCYLDCIVCSDCNGKFLVPMVLNFLLVSMNLPWYVTIISLWSLNSIWFFEHIYKHQFFAFLFQSNISCVRIQLGFTCTFNPNCFTYSEIF